MSDRVRRLAGQAAQPRCPRRHVTPEDSTVTPSGGNPAAVHSRSTNRLQVRGERRHRRPSRTRAARCVTVVARAVRGRRSGWTSVWVTVPPGRPVGGTTVVRGHRSASSSRRWAGSGPRPSARRAPPEAYATSRSTPSHASCPSGSCSSTSRPVASSSTVRGRGSSARHRVAPRREPLRVSLSCSTPYLRRAPASRASRLARRTRPEDAWPSGRAPSRPYRRYRIGRRIRGRGVTGRGHRPHLTATAEVGSRCRAHDGAHADDARGQAARHQAARRAEA